eukprot:gene15448-6696_t
MAEPPNHMQNPQVNDILSAALGQSGLTFTETEEDDVQDVFAALSADGDFPSYMQRQNSVRSSIPAGRTASRTNKIDTSGHLQSDLDDIMDLINSDSVGHQEESFSGFTHNSVPVPSVPLVQQQKVYTNNESTSFALSGLLKMPAVSKSEQFVEYQSKEIANLVDSLKESSAGLLHQSSSTLQTSRIQFPGNKEVPGLKNILALQRNKDVLGLQFARKVEVNHVDAEQQEEIEEEEEELGYTDTFADYMPSKVKIGKKHPDPVVETSSMASVSPPDVWYKLSLPSEIIEGSFLSALQLEAVIYACQQHEHLLPDGKRAGFLIGDGAGVGKGRTVAGIIYENYLLGRKRAIWLSVSNDLRYDAERDLRDIGCNISVHALNKFKYDEKISSRANGKVKKGIVFSTYSSLIGETQGKARFKTRLSQLLHWCGEDYNGVVSFLDFLLDLARPIFLENPGPGSFPTVEHGYSQGNQNDVESQSQTWSEYKHHNTWKALIGISPNGAITFISKLWSGRVSDKELTSSSGLLSLLEPGDNVMADRGFDIANILPPGVTLNIPPFKGSRDQLTPAESEETAKIAAVRIHVERAIGRVKNYHILDGVLPLSLAPVANQIFTVCCLLTNFLPFLVNPQKNDN